MLFVPRRSAHGSHRHLEPTVAVRAKRAINATFRRSIFRLKLVYNLEKLRRDLRAEIHLGAVWDFDRENPRLTHRGE